MGLKGCVNVVRYFDTALSQLNLHLFAQSATARERGARRAVT